MNVLKNFILIGANVQTLGRSSWKNNLHNYSISDHWRCKNNKKNSCHIKKKEKKRKIQNLGTYFNRCSF